MLFEITNDLGGLDRLSEGQRQIAKRCALMSIECERMEGEMIAGRPINLDKYGMLCDRMGRAFQRLGIKRVAKDMTLDGYLEGGR